MALLTGAGTLTLVSLGFLAASIYPQKFDYLAKQQDLLTLAHDLMRAEQTREHERQEMNVSALITLKIEVARQYAKATDRNQQINERRERHCSIAGLAALGSVLATIFLVGVTYAHYLSIRADKEVFHAETGSSTTLAPADGTRLQPAGRTNRLDGAGAPADATRH